MGIPSSSGNATNARNSGNARNAGNFRKNEEQGEH